MPRTTPPGPKQPTRSTYRHSRRIRIAVWMCLIGAAALVLVDLLSAFL